MNAAPPPPTKNHIGFFFKSKTLKASPATVSAQNEMKLSSSERFLNGKENDMLKKFITKLKVSFEQIFTDDVRNDQNIMDFLNVSLQMGSFQSSPRPVQRKPNKR